MMGCFKMEKLDYLAMAILPALMSRYGQDGYTDLGAIREAYHLADIVLTEQTTLQQPTCREGVS
jgi:hypothetical protein